MAPFLIEQLERLGNKVRSDARNPEQDWAALAEEAAELTASATHLLVRLEAAGSRCQPTTPQDWNEAAAREFIPQFQEWFDYATELKDLRNNCKAHGFPVEGGAEFLSAYNRAKIMALHFDSILENTRRISRGERIGVPLEEVMDELRHRSGS